MSAWLPTLRFAQRIDKDVERPSGGDARIELANRPGRAVARVGEKRLAVGRAFVVDLLKGRARQIHLAAYFEVWRRSVVQSQRQRADRLEVGCNVLALRAVTACRADAEATLLVAQHDCQTVDFGLDREVANLAPEQAGDPLVPGAQRVGREGVGQAEHRHPMWHHGELGRRAGSDALCRRIR